MLQLFLSLKIREVEKPGDRQKEKTRKKEDRDKMSKRDKKVGAVPVHDLEYFLKWVNFQLN